MGRPDFGRPAAPPVAHALHDDEADVVNGDVIRTKWYIQIYNTITKGLSSNPQQYCHKIVYGSHSLV